jgi:hypothetical protein
MNCEAYGKKLTVDIEGQFERHCFAAAVREEKVSEF